MFVNIPGKITISKKWFWSFFIIYPAIKVTYFYRRKNKAMLSFLEKIAKWIYEDPRPLILFVFFTGVVVWQLPAIYLLLFFIVFILLLALPSSRIRLRRLLPPYSMALLFWFVIMFGAELFDNTPPEKAFFLAFVFIARILIVFLAGLTVFRLTSSHRLGQSLAWFIQPVSGKNAWKAGLGVALMSHLLPTLLNVAQTKQQIILYRLGKIPFHKRMELLAVNLIRAIFLRSWQQGIAIVARKLDREKLWTENFTFHPALWLAFLGAIGGGILLLFQA